MAFRGHFSERHVHKPLRGLKNRCNAEAENVDFVRGLERPCYLVFVAVRFDLVLQQLSLAAKTHRKSLQLLDEIGAQCQRTKLESLLPWGARRHENMPWITKNIMIPPLGNPF